VVSGQLDVADELSRKVAGVKLAMLKRLTTDN